MTRRLYLSVGHDAYRRSTGESRHVSVLKTLIPRRTSHQNLQQSLAMREIAVKIYSVQYDDVHVAIGDHRSAACASGHVIPGGVRQPSGYTQLARRSAGVLLDAGSVVRRGCRPPTGCKPGNDKCRCAKGRSSVIHQRLTMPSAYGSVCVAHDRTKVGAART